MEFYEIFNFFSTKSKYIYPYMRTLILFINILSFLKYEVYVFFIYKKTDFSDSETPSYKNFKAWS